MAYRKIFSHAHGPGSTLATLALSSLLMLPAYVTGAGDSDYVTGSEEELTVDAEESDVQTGEQEPRSDHAVHEASADLVMYMTNNPEEFIGRNLEFTNGTVIGPVQDLRRKVDDLQLYLVVDATSYFNEETTYAVSARDVASIADGTVRVVEEQGMHLRGLVYYPEDFTDVDDFSPDGYEITPSDEAAAED